MAKTFKYVGSGANKYRTVRRNSKKQLDLIFKDGSFSTSSQNTGYKHVKIRNEVARKEFTRYRSAVMTIDSDEKTGFIHFHSRYSIRFKMPYKLNKRL